MSKDEGKDIGKIYMNVAIETANTMDIKVTEQQMTDIIDSFEPYFTGEINDLMYKARDRLMIGVKSHDERTDTMKPTELRPKGNIRMDEMRKDIVKIYMSVAMEDAYSIGIKVTEQQMTVIIDNFEPDLMVEIRDITDKVRKLLMICIKSHNEGKCIGKINRDTVVETADTIGIKVTERQITDIMDNFEPDLTDRIRELLAIDIENHVECEKGGK